MPRLASPSFKDKAISFLMTVTFRTLTTFGLLFALTPISLLSERHSIPSALFLADLTSSAIVQSTYTSRQMDRKTTARLAKDLFLHQPIFLDASWDELQAYLSENHEEVGAGIAGTLLSAFAKPIDEYALGKLASGKPIVTQSLASIEELKTIIQRIGFDLHISVFHRPNSEESILVLSRGGPLFSRYANTLVSATPRDVFARDIDALLVAKNPGTGPRLLALGLERGQLHSAGYRLSHSYHRSVDNVPFPLKFMLQEAGLLRGSSIRSEHVEHLIESDLGLPAAGKGFDLLFASQAPFSKSSFLASDYHNDLTLFWKDIQRPESPARRWVTQRLLDNLGPGMGSGQTGFLRHSHQFEVLRQQLQRFVAQRMTNRAPIRMVSAGASLGYEAFSMAAESLMEASEHPDWWEGSALRVPFMVQGIELHPTRVAEARDLFLSDAPWPEAFPLSTSLRWDSLEALRSPIQSLLTFDELSLIDKAALDTIANADIVFLNNVLYLLNDLARERLVEALQRTRIGTVLIAIPSQGLNVRKAGFTPIPHAGVHMFIKGPPSQTQMDLRPEADLLPEDESLIRLRLLEIKATQRSFIDRLKQSAQGVRRVMIGLRGYVADPTNYAGVLSAMKRYGGPLADKRLFEVGSSAGVFLQALQTLGLSAEGMDTNPKLVELGQAEGIRLYEGDILRSETHPQTTYDITFSVNLLDALQEDGWVEDPHQTRSRRDAFSNNQRARLALKNFYYLTAPGGLSIHEAELGFPFNLDDVRESGFEILQWNIAENLIVLRRPSSPTPQRHLATAA